MSAVEPGGSVVTGPLARYEAPFRAHLERAGYARRSVRDLVRTMARASRWLEGRGLQAGGITPPVAADLEAGVPGSGPVLLNASLLPDCALRARDRALRRVMR